MVLSTARTTVIHLSLIYRFFKCVSFGMCLAFCFLLFPMEGIVQERLDEPPVNLVKDKEKDFINSKKEIRTYLDKFLGKKIR